MPKKYGVFFKESYVFIDGLINNDHQISGIKIGGTNYTSCPYIPSDPSILPVNLNSEGIYTWNAYIMPESVLNATQANYPNFVFTNPLKEYKFSTEPGPNNLRQFVEQQN